MANLGFEYPVKSLEITLNNLENLVLIHDKENMFLPPKWVQNNEQADDDEKIQLTSMSSEEIDIIKKRILETKTAISLLTGDHNTVQKFLLKLE